MDAGMTGDSLTFCGERSSLYRRVYMCVRPHHDSAAGQTPVRSRERILGTRGPRSGRRSQLSAAEMVVVTATLAALGLLTLVPGSTDQLRVHELRSTDTKT
eukprot:4515967-Prymnesium_polylepis.2